MTKAELRKIFKDKRNQISGEQKERYDRLLLRQWQKFPLPYIKTVLSYFPIVKQKEPQTLLISDDLKKRQPQLILAYPRTDFKNGTMEAIAIPDKNSRFFVNKQGITEPENGTILAPQEIDLVLIPMLACDSKGFRVGYGKGFYDRYLERCKKDIIKIGICYFEPVPEIEDCGPFDIPLHYCLTPEKIYAF